jgi:hypothetical protein
VRTFPIVLLIASVLAGCSAKEPAAPSAPVATPAKAEAAPVDPAIAKLQAAQPLLGVDPIPALRGRFETCFSGDKQAFAAFYLPENSLAFLSKPQLLDAEFVSTCGDGAAGQPAPDFDELFRGVQVYARPVPHFDRGKGGPVYQLCVSNEGPAHCTQDGNWGHDLEVREGRVLFLARAGADQADAGATPLVD